MQYYDNILTVEAGWLIDNGIMTRENYRQLSCRGDINVVRRGCRGQQALVEFSGATLEETAALVIQLEQSPLVERAAVSAVSAAAGAPADVELLIQLTTGEEDEP